MVAVVFLVKGCLPAVSKTCVKMFSRCLRLSSRFAVTLDQPSQGAFVRRWRTPVRCACQCFLILGPELGGAVSSFQPDALAATAAANSRVPYDLAVPGNFPVQMGHACLWHDLH